MHAERHCLCREIHEPRLPDAEVVGAADDHVVEHLDAHDPAGGDHLTCNRQILGAGSRIPRAVVVGKDEAGRPVEDGAEEYLPWRQKRGIGHAQRDEVLLNEPVLAVHRQQKAGFLRHVGGFGQGGAAVQRAANQRRGRFAHARHVDPQGCVRGGELDLFGRGLSGLHGAITDLILIVVFPELGS